MDDKKARRRVALVTGASQGIGAATALALARVGYDVAVSDLRPGDLAATLAALAATPARVAALALDLRRLASIEKTIADVAAELGPIDLLVNNAGVTLRKAAVEVTEAEWDEVVGIDLKGTFFISQQMGRHLIAGGRGGVIVSIASAHGLVGFAARSTYGIAKAGIVHMTRMLAIEWAAHGIRVNAIAPGTVETPSRAPFLAEPAARAAMLGRIPAGRFGTAEEVAAAVRYLASDEAAYITGQTLSLDGGLTAY
jgi:NAD(P)-dependent dehydrogenase (short-subunit alcohol dehydrogenase family)